MSTVRTFLVRTYRPAANATFSRIKRGGPVGTETRLYSEQKRSQATFTTVFHDDRVAAVCRNKFTAELLSEAKIHLPEALESCHRPSEFGRDGPIRSITVRNASTGRIDPNGTLPPFYRSCSAPSSRSSASLHTYRTPPDRLRQIARPAYCTIRHLIRRVTAVMPHSTRRTIHTTPTQRPMSHASSRALHIANVPGIATDTSDSEYHFPTYRTQPLAPRVARHPSSLAAQRPPCCTPPGSPSISPRKSRMLPASAPEG